MSRGTPDTGLFKVASPTGFSPSVMPAFQLTSTRNFEDSAGPYPSHPFGYSVWALPRSLAATYGITFVFSSSGYLDVSVHRVPSLNLWIQFKVTEVFSAGLPHSDICGSKIICISPQLFAAYHVFHRLLVPRHPPCALHSLTISLTVSSKRLAV